MLAVCDSVGRGQRLPLRASGVMLTLTLTLAPVAAAQQVTDPANAESASAALTDEPEEETPQNANAEKEDRARALYAQGAEAYEETRYKDAIDHFLAAGRLIPNPVFSYNIGLAYDDMGDDASALSYYRDYVRRSPEADDLAEVEERIVALAEGLEKKGIQQVTVASEPAGARVSVDGQPRGITPWTGELSPGSHSVTIQLQGYADSRAKFELRRDRPAFVEVSLHSERKAVPAAKPVPVLENPKPPPTPHIRPFTWAAYGGGAAALGASMAFEFGRSSAEDAARDSKLQVEAESQWDTAESRMLTSRVFAGAGLMFVALAGVLTYRDLNRPDTDRSDQLAALRWSVGCGPDGCGANYRGSF